MARIQINFPEKSIFYTQLKIRITDINYGQHLGNDAVLGMMHECRVQFLNEFGYSEMAIEGEGLIMSDVAIHFKNQAYYGQQLKIEIAVGDFSKVAFYIYYKMSCNNQLIAIAKTGMVFFNYSRQKIVAVPKLFLEKLQLSK